LTVCLFDNLALPSSLQLKLETDLYREDIRDENMKLMCYRIVQVQLNNIIKHARAKNATVLLKRGPNCLELTMQDDGIGFDMKKKSSGIGLRNIKNRVGLYNGVVTIESAPGKGCILKVVIPLN